MKKKPPFLEIIWLDSETESGWDSPDKVKYPTKHPTSYGFFIKEDDTFITLGADLDETNGHYNRFIHIPKVNILKKRKIKI